jgi:multidrug efflux pump subunit AcrA (membrane-fusion protein)
MNPEVTSPVPAKDDMGMNYVPVYADEAQSRRRAHAGPRHRRDHGRGFRIAGVQTAPAIRQRLTRSTRTVGSVLADERRIRRVNTKIGGWVEKLHVNYTGQAVRAGDPVLAIYSPELLASQEEYLRARESAARFAASSIPEVRRGAEDLVASARRRLELFDVPQSFLATLERTGRAQRTVTLVAPVSGVVSAKQVVEGMAITPGLELFTLTDLSHVWVEAQFYENEARLLRLGQRAAVRLPYDPGHPLSAEVTFLSPTLSPESRTLAVRLELANPDGQLKPGMFVDVTSDLESAEGRHRPGRRGDRHRRPPGRVRRDRPRHVRAPRGRGRPPRLGPRGRGLGRPRGRARGDARQLPARFRIPAARGAPDGVATGGRRRDAPALTASERRDR